MLESLLSSQLGASDIWLHISLMENHPLDMSE